MFFLTAGSQFERFNLTSLDSGAMSGEFKDGQQEHIVKWMQQTWKTFFGSFSGWGGGAGRKGGGSLLKYLLSRESWDTPKSRPGHMVPILVSWPRVKTVHIVTLTFRIWLVHTGPAFFQSEFANEWMNECVDWVTVLRGAFFALDLEKD